MDAYGALENILAHAAEITKKRPREALLEQARYGAAVEGARHDPRRSSTSTLDLDAMRVVEPDRERLRALYVELEFHTLAKDIAAPAGRAEVRRVASGRADRTTSTVDSVAMLQKAIARARKAPHIARRHRNRDRSRRRRRRSIRCAATLVGIAIAVGAGRGVLPVRSRIASGKIRKAHWR